MTTAQFKQAFALADSGAELAIHDANLFYGFGLRSFQPMVATVAQVASLIRWQGLHFMRGPNDPKWDMDAVNEVRDCLRRKVTIVG